MRNHTRVAVAGLMAGALALGLTAGVLLAQPSPSQPGMPLPPAGQSISHEQMHQMMDMMHGPGTSERMHALMGEESERLMEQCAAMMVMMRMPGMMGR